MSDAKIWEVIEAENNDYIVVKTKNRQDLRKSSISRTYTVENQLSIPF